jgi:hypothetical protein
MKYLYECPECSTRYWRETIEPPMIIMEGVLVPTKYVQPLTVYSPDKGPELMLSPANLCCCGNVFIKDLIELNVCEYTPEQMEQVSYEGYELEDLDGNFIETVTQMTLRQVTDKAEMLCESLHTQVEVWVNIYDENVGPLRDLIYVASCSE